MTHDNRLEMLLQMVKSDPDDDFSRYGLALEYNKIGEYEKAFKQFRELVQRHPDYVPAYLMWGQYLIEQGDEEQAAQRLLEGIEAARRIGDTHALAEMQEVLKSLE